MSSLDLAMAFPTPRLPLLGLGRGVLVGHSLGSLKPVAEPIRSWRTSSSCRLPECSDTGLFLPVLLVYSAHSLWTASLSSGLPLLVAQSCPELCLLRPLPPCLPWPVRRLTCAPSRLCPRLLPEGLQEDPRDQGGGAPHHHLPAGELLLRGHRACLPRPALRVQRSSQGESDLCGVMTESSFGGEDPCLALSGVVGCTGMSGSCLPVPVWCPEVELRMLR